MQPCDSSGLGERLERELKGKGWAITKLRSEVTNRLGDGHPHTSYGSVWSYVNGQAPDNPRREVLEAMADALGVRVEYLLHDGPRTDAEASRESTGLVHTLLDGGKVRFSGPTRQLEELGQIMTAMNAFPDLPTAARDVVTRFLWDVSIHHPTLFVNPDPDIGGVDEQAVVAFAEKRFPMRTRGSYGEVMATVLALAQLAYLDWFGSSTTTEQ